MPPDIRRDVCARMEKTKQETNEAFSLYGQHPAKRRLKSRNCFLLSVKPAEFSPTVIRCNEWLRRLQTPQKVTVNLSEITARKYDIPWTTWRCLNRLHTGFTCSKAQRHKWEYYEGDINCECGLASGNTTHMMQCTLLAWPCSLDDLVVVVYPLPSPLLVGGVRSSRDLNSFNDIAKKCAEKWKPQVRGHQDDEA